MSGFVAYSAFKYFANEIQSIKRDYQREELDILSPMHKEMEEALISYAEAKTMFDVSKETRLVHDMAKAQTKFIKLGLEASKNKQEREKLLVSSVRFPS